MFPQSVSSNRIDWLKPRAYFGTQVAVLLRVGVLRASERVF